MRSRQIAERLGVEEAHMLEFQQFNTVWDKRMADYESHAEDMVFAMRVRVEAGAWTEPHGGCYALRGCRHCNNTKAFICATPL